MSVIDGGSLHESTREMLLKERSTVLARIHSIEQDALSVELETDGVPASGYEREHALTRMLDSRLGDIENALARLEEGTYGTCASCASQIPPRRLEVHPFATLCVSCQSIADKRLRRHA